MIAKIQNILKRSEAKATPLQNKKNKFSTIFFKIFAAITVTSLIILFLSELNSFFRFRKILRDISKIESIDQYLRQRPDLGLDVDLSKSYKKLIISYEPKIINNFIASFLVGLTSASILGAFLSRHISKPLTKLKETINKAKKQNYSIRAKEVGPDEIKQVSQAFNHLIEELQQQEKLRVELSSDISHELKTPITKIRGQIEGILDGVYQADEKHLLRILGNITQLEYLINRIYEVNRLNNQDTKLKKQPCQIKPMVYQAISGYKTNGIKFEIKVQDDLVIKADSGALQRVFDNLVSNAYKFTDQGFIKIEATQEHFKIEDSGIGIPKNEIPLVFKRFYRVEKSRNKDQGGLGLGLFIVKKLINMHGWTIEAHSQLDHGTTFIIKWNK